ncbi:MAG: translation initiation factor IF-3 [Candidatus Spechtbacteria bacterium]|nr:translation initiation factor IF-3 [Candidatus Spechtbacteria bacterium]
MPNYKRYRRPVRKAPIALPRTNQQITALEVRLLGEEGENIGVVSTQEALRMAREKGLDLVEVSAKAVPPVARIIERGKFLYELEKKEKKTSKQQKVDDLKSIRLRLSTSPHDLELKAEQVDKFLKKGYKVQIELQLRGREKAQEGMARDRIKAFLSNIHEQYHVGQEPKKSMRGIQVQINK